MTYIRKFWHSPGLLLLAAGIWLLAGLAITSTSCAKHVSTLTPSQNFLLSMDQSLDVLAHSNQAVGQVAEGLPSGLIPASTQRDIVLYVQETAQVIQQAHTALSSGQTVQQRTTAVLAALNVIQQLPASVKAVTSNPQTNQTITNLANLIINSVELAKQLAVQAQTQASSAAAAQPAPIVNGGKQ